MLVSILFILSYLLIWCIFFDSFNEKVADFTEGSETKSKQINKKSSDTIDVSSPAGINEPYDLDDIPNLIPDLNNSFKIFPDGVESISIVPITLLPSQCISVIL